MTRQYCGRRGRPDIQTIDKCLFVCELHLPALIATCRPGVRNLARSPLTRMPPKQFSTRNELHTANHHLSCAILHSSVSLLSSGLESLVRCNLSSKRNLFSEDIFSCCYVGLITSWESDIRDSVGFLVNRCVQSSNASSIKERVIGSAFLVPSVGLTKTFMNAATETCKGETGRQISSRHDKEVERGTVIIHEEPFLATVVADCKCREGASTGQ